MARKRELQGREREMVAGAIGAWSGRKATPEYVARAEPRQPRTVVMPPPPKNQESTEAQADAEALLADLTSPSMLRRRGAKSTLRWMADDDRSVRFDTYDESVVAATEWDGINAAAVSIELQEILDRLNLARYSAQLARMGIASLSDVGKRTPDALVNTGGLAPRECHALLSELLIGQATPAARLEVRGVAWERTEMPMWEQPPRLESQGARTSARLSPEQPDQRSAAAVERRLVHQRQQWQAERSKLAERISELDAQEKELRRTMQQHSHTLSSVHSKYAMRGEVLMAEISDLEERLDKSETESAQHKQRADGLTQTVQRLHAKQAQWDAERLKMQRKISALERAVAPT